MPVNLTYPGVYVDEVPSQVRTIVGVPTSVTAFVGSAVRGPIDNATHITSWADFERTFGGISASHLMSYAVFNYYQNGGSEAEIVRIANGAKPAKLDLEDGVTLEAASPGAWGNSLRARVDYQTKDPSDAKLYNLTLRDMSTGQEERYLNVSTDPNVGRTLDRLLTTSRLATSTGATNKRPAENDPPAKPGTDPFADPTSAAPPPGPPPAPPGPPPPPEPKLFTQAADGANGEAVTDAQYTGDESKKTGIYALLNTDIFNLLCLAPISRETDLLPDTWDMAAKLCLDRRSVLLVDAPASWTTVAEAVTGAGTPLVSGDNAKNAAIYFPRIRLFDETGDINEFPAAGSIAGLIARTDSQRGVWKAPAGTDASVSGVQGLTVPMTNLEHGQLNPLGINCIRNFPVIGTVAWGARTMRGADRLADQWKYLSIRRTALFIEESLYRATQWVVFEPNDEPLWASIRLNIGAFMNSLWRQGAFQGKTPQDAYLVKCDGENNPQNDINRGIVNILVGFAPLYPAEFVLIHLQQLAGQVQT